MILKMVQTGPLQVNCYILGDRQAGQAAVFDPGGDAEDILRVLSANELELQYIINTHAHWDHVGANRELQEKTGAPILLHRDEAPGLKRVGTRARVYGFEAPESDASGFIEEGDVIRVGSIPVKVLDLRGHSPAGLGFLFEGELDSGGRKQFARAVICGDALFAGSIGRTDFPGGDMERLLENIRTKVFTLPDDTLVLPGHGPTSTVGREKHGNPFFQG